MGVRKEEGRGGGNVPSNVQILEMAGSEAADFLAVLIMAFELSTP